VKTSERGQGMVEFVLPMIVMIVIVLGMIDLGPFLFDWMGAKLLSAKGARAAAIYKPDGTRTCRGDVLNAIGTTELFSATYTVAIPDICDWSPQTTIPVRTPLEVTINLMYTPLFWGGFGWPPKDTTTPWPMSVSTEDQYR
jgi:Flp pilus assembly protein TadG